MAAVDSSVEKERAVARERFAKLAEEAFAQQRVSLDWSHDEVLYTIRISRETDRDLFTLGNPVMI